jgi:hypothetical protein
MQTESLWGNSLKKSLLERPRVLLKQSLGNAVGYIRKLQNAVTVRPVVLWDVTPGIGGYNITN